VRITKSAAGPVSRILSVPASRDATVIPLGRASLPGSSDLPEGCDAPSRHVFRHRSELWAVSSEQPALRLLTAHSPPPPAPSDSGTPFLFGLAPCGVCPARGITVAAVRSYRTFSPLPASRKMQAVCFLWRFPSNGLEPALPDVIRHTALRSSDFPLPASEDAESDRPVRLPTG